MGDPGFSGTPGLARVQGRDGTYVTAPCHLPGTLPPARRPATCPACHCRKPAFCEPPPPRALPRIRRVPGFDSSPACSENPGTAAGSRPARVESPLRRKSSIKSARERRPRPPAAASVAGLAAQGTPVAPLPPAAAGCWHRARRGRGRRRGHGESPGAGAGREPNPALRHRWAPSPVSAVGILPTEAGPGLARP